MAINADIHPQQFKTGRDDLDEDTVKIYKRSLATEYNVYLPIDIPQKHETFLDFFNILTTATDPDIINVHIANYGGSVHTGFRLARYLKACSARVIMHVDGNCYSMGAILALCGHGMTTTKGIELMFHNFSAVQSGKGHELEASVESITRNFQHNLKLFCKPFLTEKEIIEIAHDKDLYVVTGTKDFTERLNRHFGATPCKKTKPSSLT